ncbi:MAG: 30S ribosomal protein S12 methylthiotransferase RimO [Acidithiobacillus ferriphilus]|uniref:Ribosomal protein uS12 methylthiotransferase RimO n=1 Tax=Acidithiobacillus ferrivorans TaxID=160808 RepID=A0A257TBE4_9PROT|nr:30S ribosomal protein S12 methylthiotransferase RimO [Acidithiobacillus ferriphilus]OYV81826.1 MAG: ribosomal protein S12 methylthiotransferase [Acidithiobacillus ferrivorans]MBU2785184.1 30S ribosomal protein S12 methylthiotransferase RimO [Acidithiobacillus ferriphilus]MBU2828198.1 30S ribosomal protein S12 methylthiotransferase RimO [Acidithiobacillus ferriphilus]MBU2845978.1 30S ribosomal protein S12 methylthiotransferase RimO [Acidithiobacillus ferriphilus]MEB8475074.1 30S ribosomal pr
MKAGANTPSKVGFVSLGCPKATVDSERILTQLRAEGYLLVGDYASADVVVVNTCGFIDAAVAESLEAIGEALEENGKVVVTGCLGAREGGDFVRGAHPKVLAVTGPNQASAVLDAIHEALPPAHDPFTDLVPPQGLRLTPPHYAYLKISEGCNQSCSFCIIPSMRGKLVSREPDDILREAEALVTGGVKELLVISQDTGAYGVDRKYRTAFHDGRPLKTRITDLCAALGDLGVWVRLHYVYPYPHIDELLPLMAAGKILPYLDVPLQHGSPRILKAMRRPAAAEKTLDRILGWRRIVPDLTIRSTFIVGFPGETDADFAELLDFLRAAELDRVGCFAYSPVEGAPANAIAGAVPEPVKEERRAEFMAVQEAISRGRLQRRVGQRQRVLVDAVGRGGKVIARSASDAPEIDGVVHLGRAAGLQVGDWVEVEITRADAHDLYGVLVSD